MSQLITFYRDAEIQTVLDARTAYDAVQRGLVQQAAGRVGLSEPPSLRTRIPDGFDTVLQAKGAYVLDDGLIGLRIGGIRDEVSVDEGRLILLYDVERLQPVAMLEERTIYRLRVGAELAVTVALLRPEGARRIAVIGSGRLARSTLEVIDLVTPFDQVVISSRTAARREALVEALAPRLSASLAATGSAAEACRGADVVLTITTATSPVVQASWCADATLIVSAGSGLECDPALYARADRLVVDDWEQCMTLGDLAALRASGDVAPEDVSARLCDLVTGAVPTGSDPGELVMAVPQGLTFLDVAVAQRALDGLSADRRSSVPPG